MKWNFHYVSLRSSDQSELHTQAGAIFSIKMCRAAALWREKDERRAKPISIFCNKIAETCLYNSWELRQRSKVLLDQELYGLAFANTTLVAFLLWLFVTLGKTSFRKLLQKNMIFIKINLSKSQIYGIYKWQK